MDQWVARARQAVQSTRLRFVEIRLERRLSTTVRYRGSLLEACETHMDSGGIVRVLTDHGGWGVSSFNDIDSLEKRIRQAQDCAGVMHGAPLTLADVPPVQDTFDLPVEQEIASVDLATKKQRLEAINRRLLEHDERIVDTRTAYLDRYVEKAVVTSEGTCIRYNQSFAQARLGATAREGNQIQEAFWGDGDTGSGFAVMDRADQMPETIAQRAIDLLSAAKVKAGTYPAVLNPKLAGVFIHEAFGHLSEADFICENRQGRELMTLGKKVGPDFLNVYDDGTQQGLWGYHKYDDEGVPTQATPLIREGVLSGRLHSRYTAGVMEEQPTGNAYAITYAHEPIVRMTNTYIDRGQTSFDDMIADIDEGVYCCDMFGGQTALENFTFSAGYGYMIRKGKLAEMVRDVVLQGNVFTTLNNVRAVGNDLAMFGGGGCGKNGQSPLPVSLGSGHLMVDNVLIGGQS